MEVTIMDHDNSTTCHRPTERSMILSVRYVFGYFNASTTAMVLVFATLSWILIPKWRTYSNFIFSNLFLTDILLYLCFINWYSNAKISFQHVERSLHLFGRYVNFVYFCWLFVFSINIYMEVVHFKLNLTRKFVKSSVFAWGLPLILHIMLLLLRVTDPKPHLCHPPSPHHLHSSLVIKLTLEIVLLVVNLIGYIAVLIILIMQKIRDDSLAGNKICVVTRTFVLCFVLWVLSVILEACISKRDILSDVYSTYFIMHCTQMTYLKVYFLLLKTNRKRWKKYFRKLFQNVRTETIQMVTVK